MIGSAMERSVNILFCLAVETLSDLESGLASPVMKTSDDNAGTVRDVTGGCVRQADEQWRTGNPRR